LRENAGLVSRSAGSAGIVEPGLSPDYDFSPANQSLFPEFERSPTMPKGRRNPEVDTYIKKSPEFARPILLKLRELFHKAESQIQETVKWGVPHFEHKGIVGSFAAFKHHVGFGFWKSKLMQDPAGLFGKDPKASMCSSKFTSLEQLPSDKVLLTYIKEAVALNENEVKVPAAKRKRAKLTAPDFFLAALRKNKKAQKTYEGFSESNRRDYIEWMLEAKQDATREKRLKAAMEWLADGKPRNWKYLPSRKK
jgi:hypothetical protein